MFLPFSKPPLPTQSPPTTGVFVGTYEPVLRKSTPDSERRDNNADNNKKPALRYADLDLEPTSSSHLEGESFNSRRDRVRQNKAPEEAIYAQSDRTNPNFFQGDEEPRARKITETTIEETEEEVEEEEGTQESSEGENEAPQTASAPGAFQRQMQADRNKAQFIFGKSSGRLSGMGDGGPSGDFSDDEAIGGIVQFCFFLNFKFPIYFSEI
jgi:hypothetical protein